MIQSYVHCEEAERLVENDVSSINRSTRVKGTGTCVFPFDLQTFLSLPF